MTLSEMGVDLSPDSRGGLGLHRRCRWRSADLEDPVLHFPRNLPGDRALCDLGWPTHILMARAIAD
jgi:hypothetical protein